MMQTFSKVSAIRTSWILFKIVLGSVNRELLKPLPWFKKIIVKDIYLDRTLYTPLTFKDVHPRDKPLNNIRLESSKFIKSYLFNTYALTTQFQYSTLYN